MHIFYLAFLNPFGLGCYLSIAITALARARFDPLRVPILSTVLILSHGLVLTIIRSLVSHVPWIVYISLYPRFISSTLFRNTIQDKYMHLVNCGDVGVGRLELDRFERHGHSGVNFQRPTGHASRVRAFGLIAKSKPSRRSFHEIAIISFVSQKRLLCTSKSRIEGIRRK
jgi:hypothetical protein